MLDVSELNDAWRVFYIDDSGANIVERWRKRFPTFNTMPNKTKEAVACLSMCENQGRIKGVGQKVSERTFWLDSTEEILKGYEPEIGTDDKEK